MDKCIACGLCAEKCPKKVDGPLQRRDQQTEGHLSSIQPDRAPEICHRQTIASISPKGKCQACAKVLPHRGHQFRPGVKGHGRSTWAPSSWRRAYQAFDPSALSTFGYGHIPNVVTGLEYERMLSAGGPFMGHLVRPSDHKEPEKVAWIQCVGSRNTTARQQLLLHGLLHVRGETDGHARAPERHATASHFLHGFAQPQQRFERYDQDAKAKGVRFIKSPPPHRGPRPRQYRGQASLCHRGRR